MDSYASTSPHHSPNAQVLLDRIADAVYRSFESALTEQCSNRDSLDVTVDRTAEGQPSEFSLRCHDLIEMTATLSVQHVGGNVYDVYCTIEDDTSQQFVYCLPDKADAPLPPVPRLGRNLAVFLLDELEQSYGRQNLRDE